MTAADYERLARRPLTIWYQDALAQLLLPPSILRGTTKSGGIALENVQGIQNQC